jgi:D-glycero-alpha-D-manno-heptose-7-phosphate kinase
VQVDAALVARAPAGPVRLVAPDIGVDQVVQPGGASGERSWRTPAPGLHPLLEHAIAAVLAGVDLPDDVGVEVRVSSPVPPGASLGTSAAVVVALLGALDALVGGGRFPDELAALAHQVETQRAGREAGVQDQWAAALGGVGLLAIGPYPEVRREAIVVPSRAAAELDERLVTIVFGAHDSSLVHAEVINAIVGCGGVEHDRARHALGRLASLAGDAAAALTDGAVDRWAEVLVAATEAQRDLHAGLIGPAHQAAIDTAQAHGAVGWKVNGAGGDGGSLTLVAASGSAERLRAVLQEVDASWTVLALRPADGLRREPQPPVPS